MSAVNFRQPVEIDPRVRQKDRLLNIMAMQLNPQSLETLLHGSTPAMRQAMIDRLRPYLQFDPNEKIADCARCGMKRGSILAHECTPTRVTTDQ